MLFRNKILIFTFISLLVSGCAGTQEIVVKAGAGEQVIKAKPGNTFSIQLESQMSTGYKWSLMEKPATLELIKESVKTGENDIAGGIDTQEFVFRSMSKCEMTLTFRYAQHWKKKPQYVKTSIVKVIIE